MAEIFNFKVFFSHDWTILTPCLLCHPSVLEGLQVHTSAHVVHMYALGDGETRMRLICSPHKAIHLVKIFSLRIGIMTQTLLLPSELETLAQRWFTVSLSSTTLAQQ